MNRNLDQLWSDQSDLLSVAVRVYPQPENEQDSERSNKWRPLPQQILVFDTETRTDPTQRLTFGSYRSIIGGRCVEEGLFYGEGLTAGELRILRRYARLHKPETVHDGVRELRLLPLRDFLKVFYSDVYKARCLLVAFNHPFDLSRISSGFTDARKPYVGGFSLTLWTYLDKNGHEHRNQRRPEIGIKHIDSKRALMGFTARKGPDQDDLIPEGSRTGKPKKGYKFRGHFLDLRTLAYALTDRGHSLESACEAFGVEHGKTKVKRHGKVTAKYISYNRCDVLATCELSAKLLEEYRKHHISLQATKAFSPAAIGKGYLRDMRIKPVLQRQQDFPKQFLGFAQSAFYGGRTSAHIRKVPVPVVYTDFLSMYPTVNSLMGLWRYVTAQKITVLKGSKKKIEAFLKRVVSSPDILFNPDIWKRMPAFVRIIPNGDIVPSRSKYSLESNDWQVALNYVTGDARKPTEALWYSFPDVIASALLTKRIPSIVDAFRIEPQGVMKNLKRIRLRGATQIDPTIDDFFKVVIQQRKLLQSRRNMSEIERKRLDKALKVLANATSYGIYAQMDRRESDTIVKVVCHGIDAEPYSCHVPHGETPGEYCFPPMASLITGAARLMLALLEHSVKRLGGTYAMEDTDSMAIVATKNGGKVPCEGGPYALRDGQEAIKALSWSQINGISKRFATLNPYDRKAISGSILKIEDDNFNPNTKKQRQIYCLAISAKRYALFVKDRNGHPTLLGQARNNKEDRWSEHGLGHLLNPTDPDSEDRDWISMVWMSIIRRALGFPTKALGFEHLPAVGRTSVSSPGVMEPLENLNKGKKYAQKIKPFNFLATCHVKPFGYPVGADPERFQLIAPYDNNPKKWMKKDWINKYTGETFRVTTVGNSGNRWTARVKTYGEVLEDYEFHPESKCADARGNPCDKQTIGLLQRRHIKIKEIRFIGKESNLLEEVESGLVNSPEEAYTEYIDPRRDEWNTKILPALKKTKLKILENECRSDRDRKLSRRALIDLRAGRSRPHRKTRELLETILKKLGYL